MKNNNPHQVKYTYDPEICDKLDRRMMRVFSLDENLPKEQGNDRSYNHERGTIGYATEMIDYKKEKHFFAKPDMVALYLDYSNKLYGAGLHNLTCLGGDIDDNSVVFEYIQNMSGSVFFAISALECFCNILPLQLDKNIKDDTVILDQKNTSTGEERKVTKKQFENWSIEEKVKIFLPLVFKKYASQKNWSQFAKLKKLRNSLTHLTTNDIFPGVSQSSQKNLRRNIFIQSKINPAIIIKNLISDFYEENNRPRWLRLCKF